MTKRFLFFLHILLWIGAWIEMICAFINIITFTCYRPWWDFHYMAWSTLLELKLKMKLDKCVGKSEG
jgi:hypothetical protein